MDDEELKSLTIDEVCALQDEFDHSPTEVPGVQPPIVRWTSLHTLDEYFELYSSVSEDRRSYYLMLAIYECGCHQIPLPKWVVGEFSAGFHLVVNYQVGTWDEAFGRPHGARVNLSSKRRKRELKFQVGNVFNRLSKPYKAQLADGSWSQRYGRAIDDQLFEEIGEELGIGKTLTKELYYSQKELFSKFRE